MTKSQFTAEQLQNARRYAAQGHWECAYHAFDDDFGFADHVTDDEKREYVRKEREIATNIEAGNCDSNFTVRQNMHYFLTGETISFLP